MSEKDLEIKTPQKIDDKNINVKEEIQNSDTEQNKNIQPIEEASQPKNSKDENAEPLTSDENTDASDVDEAEAITEDDTVQPDIIIKDSSQEETTVDAETTSTPDKEISGDQNQLPAETESQSDTDSVAEQKADSQEVTNNDAEDDTSEQEIKEKDDSAKKDKTPGGFKRFLNKYRLPLIIAAAVILIAAAIVTTIAIINAPKIMVRSAEDFLEDTAKKEVYILKKDITFDGDLDLKDDLDINLNNKTLTINGALKLTLPDNLESTINIGTYKKKVYIAGGEIKADSIIIIGKKLTLNVYSPISSEGSINVKELTIYEKINITDNKMLELISTNAKIKKEAAGTLKLSTASLILEKDASITKVVADEFSNATIKGSITESLTGGNEISFLGNSSCPEVKNTKTLYYQQETATINNSINIENIFIVNQLARPSELNIERIGTTFKCVASKVNNADLYIFTIKDSNGVIATIPSETNEADITQYIDQPKNYKISVKASSANTKINLESPELEVPYAYSIKLANPVLSIAETNDNKIILSFASIDFATIYKITINQTGIEKEATEAENMNVDLTEYMATPNSYSIKVTASYPDNSSFADSDSVMISYVKTERLAKPSITIEKTDNTVVVNWEVVPNADNYILSDGQKFIMTKSRTFSFAVEEVADNTIFTLYAQGKGFYTTSESSEMTYEYSQLAPLGALETNINEQLLLTISVDTVANASQYVLYKNGQQLTTSATPSFTVETFLPGDTFRIEAKADYYRSSYSEVTI